MRTLRYPIALGGLLGGLAWVASGCIDAVGDFYAPLTDPKLEMTSSGTTGGGGTGGTPYNCVPSLDPKTAIATSCGVFVSATGDDSAPGTQAKPVQSLMHAAVLAAAGKKTIYACAEELAGAVDLPAGLSVYGGLDCAGMPRSWLYVGEKTKTTITADAEMIPLTLTIGASTNLFDLHVLAKAAKSAGGSSIAVVADQATAEITRCVFEAGDAKDGAPGEPYPSAAMAGVMGLSGGDACSANQIFGGDTVSSMCGMPDSSSGLGGSGTMNSGGNGSDGSPGATLNGGKGEGAAVCTDGTKGDDGMPGGAGAGASGLGSISKSGFTGATGLTGTPGLVAQGGGGGGGAKGGTGANMCPVGKAGGAAGGSGGSGGCGGVAGKGGAAGGSSLALISIGATLTFTGTTLITSAGGKGGAGGLGQDGGAAGAPGAGGTAPMGLKSGCKGGPGGLGGKGGQGGGGTGGHSIAIAFLGTAPPKDGWTAMTGAFGLGGMGGDAAGVGAPGVKASMQEFK